MELSKKFINVMSILKYTLNNGEIIELNLSRTARKNVILRLDKYGELKFNVPPCLSLQRAFRWLSENEGKFLQIWHQSKQLKQARISKIEKIWFLGKRYRCASQITDKIYWHPQQGIILPDLPVYDQRKLLINWLKTQAQKYLIERLKHWSQIMQLQPQAMAISRAKTFWGVCRSKTGIRLNWRLIGAPDYVIDYVCIHELGHLKHPHHGPAFWALVDKYTEQTKLAKMWLRHNGKELFQLG